MKNSRQKNYDMSILGLLTAIMVIMMYTPLGTLNLPFMSITIAHIPILIVTLLLGLKQGLILALIFGSISMFKAITAPVSILDPLFANPLISILPRLMIPITTHYVYVGLLSLSNKFKNKTSIIADAVKSKYFRTTTAVIVGNLTNTFFVYLSIYLFVRSDFEIATGKSAVAAIIGLVSTSTFIKTIIVVFITVPIVLRVKLRRQN